MNLINEQSVTTCATDKGLQISLAQTSAKRLRSSLDSDNSDFVTSTTVSASSLSTTFAPPSSESAVEPSSSVVESINRRQIKNFSNTISSRDANQINLLRKMPTTTATTAGKTVAASVANTAAAPITTTTTKTNANIDNVNDVSDCIKTKNGDTMSSTKGATTTMLGKNERGVGCEHYKRRAMFVTPCCNKFYKCRYCHDENEAHHFDRKTLTELICVECDTRQQVQEQCQHCGVRFGKYTCLICNLFDDEDKNQYHCDGCGICRIGGRENFFHCEVCNMCLPIELQIEGHRCVENISRSNCPVCLGAIHTSRIPCHIPDCGHLLHKMCFDQLLASGHYVCPTCQTSLLDMTKMWEFLDAQASLMSVPKKYENQRVYIFCNDCHETCKTKFHFVGLKCIHCGGYNTTQDVKRRMSWVNGADSSTSA